MKFFAARSALLGAAHVALAGSIALAAPRHPPTPTVSTRPTSEAKASSSKIAPRLRPAMQSRMTEPLLVWVYFTDKGPAGRKPVPATVVSARSLQRRSKVGVHVGPADLPVDEAYVAQVRARVERVRHRTKWFNAVSVLATPAQIEAVAKLPFVRQVEPVFRGRRARDIEITPATSDARKAGPRRRTGSIDYGRSADQVGIMRIPELHDRGITGTGVLIGHFDNGYRLLTHQALADLHVVATHDFVDGDEDPAPPPEAPDTFGAHGINTLSVIAGHALGNLVGPAFDSDYVLARTENDASETPVEEDNWARAIEWADSIGIDIATTSLGYLSYDDPADSYTWEDMDGNTTLITRAADRAVANGILVFAAIGNSALPVGEQQNTINAPADGDSVISVGGVLPDSIRYHSSSVGPTSNQPPRIKPDVMALGAAVWIAGTGGTTHYGFSSGTSFACPLAAGAAALLLSVHPNATPLQVRDALRQTATRASAPDNHYGWGIVDAAAALDRLSLPVRPTGWSDMKRRYR